MLKLRRFADGGQAFVPNRCDIVSKGSAAEVKRFQLREAGQALVVKDQAIECEFFKPSQLADRRQALIPTPLLSVVLVVAVHDALDAQSSQLPHVVQRAGSFRGQAIDTAAERLQRGQS
jgi:hypothetical protein